jgi:hypothetical protein
MSAKTPVLGLQELAIAQSQPNVPVNFDLRRLEAVVQLAVLAIVNAPAGSEADGARYIVGAAPAGAFALAAAGDVAYLANGTWLFVTLGAGALAYIASLGEHHKLAGGSPSGWLFAF